MFGNIIYDATNQKIPALGNILYDATREKKGVLQFVQIYPNMSIIDSNCNDMPNPSISQSLAEEEIAVKIFERFENAVKIKKPKRGDNPEPTRITDNKGHVIAYPVIRNGNIEFSTERPKDDESFDFKASYTQGSGNVFKSHKLLGSGGFGHVKEATLLSQNKTSEPLYQSCIKTLIIPKEEPEASRRRKEIYEEYQRLKDLNQTAGEPIERESAQGIKIMLPLKNLGQPLSRYQYATPIDNKISMMIQLLLKVDDLHYGRASRSNTAYAHRDIKPENVLVDADGNVSLIDYGLSNRIGKEDFPIPLEDIKGTLGYIPVDTYHGKTYTEDDDQEETSTYSFGSAQEPDIDYVPTNNRDTDTIAALRTIFHSEDLNYPGLLSAEEFNDLPEPLQQLLTTDNIRSFLSQKNDPRLIASALTLYQFTDEIRDDQINLLRESPFYREVILKMSQEIQRSPRKTQFLPPNLMQSIEAYALAHPEINASVTANTPFISLLLPFIASGEIPLSIMTDALLSEASKNDKDEWISQLSNSQLKEVLDEIDFFVRHKETTTLLENHPNLVELCSTSLLKSLLQDEPDISPALKMKIETNLQQQQQQQQPSRALNSQTVNLTASPAGSKGTSITGDYKKKLTHVKRDVDQEKPDPHHDMDL